jgi:hypothetical protein
MYSLLTVADQAARPVRASTRAQSSNVGGAAPFRAAHPGHQLGINEGLPLSLSNIFGQRLAFTLELCGSPSIA